MEPEAFIPTKRMIPANCLLKVSGDHDEPSSLQKTILIDVRRAKPETFRILLSLVFPENR
jgi:hypothetical protein